MRDELWQTLKELKVAEYYHLHYAQHAKRCRQIVSAVCMFASAGCVVSWYYESGKSLWIGAFLLAAQIVALMQPLFPYEMQRQASCYIYAEVSYLNIEVSSAWRKVDSFTEEEIDAKIEQFQKSYHRMEEKYSNAETLAQNKRVFKKAERDTRIYLERYSYESQADEPV